METMFERIKRMSKEEMRDFIYWVYMNGQADAKDNLCDSYGDSSYFGGAWMNLDASDVMDEVRQLYED